MRYADEEGKRFAKRRVEAARAISRCCSETNVG